MNGRLLSLFLGGSGGVLTPNWRRSAVRGSSKPGPCEKRVAALRRLVMSREVDGASNTCM